MRFLRYDKAVSDYALGGDLEGAACALGRSYVGETENHFLSSKVTAF